MKDIIVNIIFGIIIIALIVEPILILIFNFNYIGYNLILLLFIEITNIIFLCYIIKGKDISKLIIVLYLLIICFIPMYNVEVENQNNYTNIMRNKGIITPSDVYENKVNVKNIFGIIIRQEKEEPEIYT